ncbi:MAG: phytoene desaturase family protein [Schleiferiaceae bacterium]|jgi:phytoene desaturase|nr:phytoene desaturase family protein [Schleiferiaceae bacterium]
MKKKISIIGSGFSSLSAACYMAKAGYEVEVFEKNSDTGGRAQQYVKDGFVFDMGPTWYWMPDVFEKFFNDFGKSSADYYEIEKLDPAYTVYFDENTNFDISGKLNEIIDLFESVEKGAGQKLEKFIEKAKQNYNIAIKDLVYKPGLSPLELVNFKTIREFKQFVLTISDYVRQNFRDEKLRQVLEFPVLFLGAKPTNTPLFYSFMNYADFGLGTWYPKGGMKSVADGFVKLAQELGVVFHLNSPIKQLHVADGTITHIETPTQKLEVESVLSGADYAHTETLLPQSSRVYSTEYWNSRTMAPSSLLFYVGFDKKLENVNHHTLFFDGSFDEHAKEIYDNPAWPKNPLFYASFPSITDNTVAPEGKETATFLIPLAPDLEDTEEMRQRYFNIIIERLEKLTKQEVRKHILFNKSYCVQDFKDDFNSYKGNAYGMANTLFQTAFLRPKLKSKKVKNLFFTGQLTVPGPGVPPAIISGKLVSDLIVNQKHATHEVSI